MVKKLKGKVGFVDEQAGFGELGEVVEGVDETLLVIGQVPTVVGWCQRRACIVVRDYMPFRRRRVGKIVIFNLGDR